MVAVQDSAPSMSWSLHLTKRAPEFHSASFGNVIRCARVPTDDRLHPAEKPAALIAALIEVTTPVGGTVVDCFAGSGVVGKVARRLGREAILIDLTGEYAPYKPADALPGQMSLLMQDSG